ncbi:MAG: hypothetical protein GY903_22730 [Fuerstiella sp.]|nr:hypothetical protein [Fuerstiella sp.]MCP4857308.1 hypothetical protein [Fuerstiella sp.]
MRFLIFVTGIAVENVTKSAEIELKGHMFTFPEGFRIEQVAGRAEIRAENEGRH